MKGATPEPAVPADLQEMLQLQQEIIEQQLYALDALVREHKMLSGGADPLEKTSTAGKGQPVDTSKLQLQYEPRLVHPSRDEITLVHMLDAQGGLRTRAHVGEFLALMSRTKGVARKATILTVLRRSYKSKVLDFFVANGGLSQISEWLTEFVQSDEAEAVQLTLKFFMELPASPDLLPKVKESGVAKIVQRLRKQEVAEKNVLGDEGENGKFELPIPFVENEEVSTVSLPSLSFV